MGMLDEMMRKFHVDCLSPIERLVFTLFDSDVNHIDVVWTDALGDEDPDFERLLSIDHVTSNPRCRFTRIDGGIMFRAETYNVNEDISKDVVGTVDAWFIEDWYLKNMIGGGYGDITYSTIVDNDVFDE